MQSITQNPQQDPYKHATDVLAAMLPKELKAQCDQLLGENADGRDRWAMYQTTLTHYQSRGSK